MRQKMSGRPPQPEKAEAGGPFFIFCILEVLALDNPHTTVYNKDKERRYPCKRLAPHQSSITKVMTATGWKRWAVISFCAFSFVFLCLTIRARLSIIKLRKGADCTVVSSRSQCHILRNMTAGVWKTIGAVIFLAILFFDIVFCVMHIPKKDLGNRPSDFGSAKDDSGQKAEQSNNSIQNFHSGILP